MLRSGWSLARSAQVLVRPIAFRSVRLYASFPDHTIIDMPALSPTMNQGNIGEWRKKIGDQLSPGDVLVEIETDKAQMDFEFQEDGYLSNIFLETGSKDVPVGKPIAVYVADEADVEAMKGFTAEDAAKELGQSAGAAPPASEEKAPEPQSTPAESSSPSKESSASDASSSLSSDAAADTTSAPTNRIFASPIAKMIALENGIPLKNIKGSGPGGRIIKRDVENYKPSASPSGPAASASAPAPAPESGSAYVDIPISSMRKTIASRLQASKRDAPHYQVSSVLKVGKLLKVREALNAEGAEQGFKLSVNDLLIKAVAAASLKVPAANSSWLENEGVIRQYTNVDVSVAVATPTGLITPIVRGANLKGLVEISTTIKDLGKRARDGKLKPEEYTGGSVTISNMGMNHAVNDFTAVINPPQSAILAVGTTIRTPFEDPTSPSGVTFEDTITVTASFDHRVVDGAVGGEWIKALKKVVENPLELLL
ncbi:hypothetical protein CANCADRAFT_32304 [Tortispora caseinolytica NRRL Y-17796]|uniref:Acetyltransferase component of pyruvate dehydrogenase complex n=1 Tax=Tortispora caseinolytica NRRL Y-17796 TaxID=767744 RepID=A0A1E4TAS1_9ASCO|nr:hypothetical protein CANCADRAFT_32304 [Tortispora caseinolytica NRRL Y-17796]